MKVLSIVNEKGGTGKTTLTFSVAWHFAEKGNRVLLVDLDPQRAGISYVAGIDRTAPNMATMYDVLVKGESIKKTILGAGDDLHLHICPATHKVSGITKDNSSIGKMKKALEEIKDYYDYVFIDIPPSPGQTMALAVGASDYVIIPSCADAMSLEANLGMAGTIQTAQKTVNPDLKVLGIVLNMYDWRTNLGKQVHRRSEAIATAIGTKVFKTKIRRSVAIAEAAAAHIGITAYDKGKGAEDIKNLCKEIMKEMEKYEE